MTTIGHLRLRALGQVSSSSALRAAAEKLLATAELRPPQLPTGALLVVRHFDGLPPVARGSAADEWTEAARQRIADLYRSAHRPIRSAVPANAQSVLFGDDAELLTCFTHDLLLNRLDSHWYWRYVRLGSEQRPLLATQSRGSGARLAAAWSAAPQALPAAFAHLPQSALQQALASLNQGEIGMVVLALHRAFLLPDLIFDLRASERIGTVPARHDTVEETHPHEPPALAPLLPGAQARLATDPTPLAAQWQQWLAPETTTALSPQAHYLAGLAAALFHTPTYARSDAFARRAFVWMQQRLHPSHMAQAAAPLLPALTPRLDPGARMAIEGRALALPSTTDPSVAQANTVQADTLQAQANSPPQPYGQINTPEPHSLQNEALSQAQRQGETSEPWEVTFAHLPLGGQGEWTALGGVFYLIHILPWLALPGKWSEYLSAWTILELLARLLLEAQVEADPQASPDEEIIWRLLASLDRRDPALSIGITLPDDGDYALSAEELELAPAWVKREFARVSIADEATLHLPSAPQLGPLQPNPAPSKISRNAARWLQARAPFYRLLLQRALGNAAPESLLLARAQIQVSRTHVDLYLSHQAVNMAVRRAGLDANPGWVPDFGYIVYFHFVEMPLSGDYLSRELL